MSGTQRQVYASDPSRVRTVRGPVLLVEFINADQFPGRINRLFPLVAGYFTSHGCSVRWGRFGLATTNLMQHDRDEITLASEDLERLVTMAQEHRPELVCLTDPLYGPQLEHVLHASSAIAALLGGEPPEMFEGLQVPPMGAGGVIPQYDWEPGNEDAQSRRLDNVYLLAPGGCGHPAPLSRNPHYADLSHDFVRQRIGCAFCTGARIPAAHPSAEVAHDKLPLSDWIRVQVESLAESSAAQHRVPNAILFEQAFSDAAIQAALETLGAVGLDGKTQLLFALRTTEVPRFVHRVRGHFDTNPSSLTIFGIHACGIESFCDEDLELYNKATTALDGIRAVNLMRELSHELPGHFWYTGLSFLLFTPWTSLENLHMTVGIIHFLRLSRREAGNMFQSRLRLHAGLGMHALAERHGLVESTVRDDVLTMNRRKLFSEEAPWRFADPRIEPISRVVLRFDLITTDLADDLAREILDCVKSVEPNWDQGDDATLQELLLCLIDVAMRECEPLEPRELLERARGLWRERRAVIPSQSMRHRVGLERMDLRDLLERALRLLGAQRPAVFIRDIRPSDMDRALLRWLEEQGVRVALHRHTRDRADLVLASDPEVLSRLERWRKSQARGFHAAASPDHEELAGLLGLPTCCVRAAGGAYNEEAFGWSAWSRRVEHEGTAPRELFPLWIPSLGFVPCAADCQAAADVYASWFDAMDAPSPLSDEVEALCSLQAHGDGDVVLVKVKDRAPGRLTYDPASVRGTDRSLSELLERSVSLRVRPGQLLVEGQACEAAFTASLALWSTGPAEHGDTWRGLAHGARLLARHAPAGRTYRPPFEGCSVGRPDGPGNASSSPVHDASQTERAERLSLVFRHVVARLSALRGHVRSIELTPAHGAVELRCEIDGTPYALALSAFEPTRPALFRTAHFNVSFLRSTPMQSGAHQRIARILVTAVDEVASRRAPDLLRL